MPDVEKMPDDVTVWAEIDGEMQQVGLRMRQKNGKLKVKWRIPYKVASQKTLFLRPVE